MAKTMRCPRCNGTGGIAEYGHIQQGLCFKCNGTGQVRKPRTQSAAAKAKAQAKAEHRAKCASESERKTEIAKEMYKNDSRLNVEATHPCYYMHAVELAQCDNIWETL